jgi:hypothetical protein
MRDSRATYQPLDYEYKQVTYRTRIRPNWDVRGVFEDDDACCAMWQAEEITCLQVRNGKA